MAPRYPSLYQVNTRVWLTSLSADLQRPATLDDVSDDELDRLAGLGFDWIWLLSVWQTGAAGRRASRTNPEWRREFQHTLADLTEDDIAGSGFAITAYETAAAIGGDAALTRFRARLQSRGVRLMLDFVPNHMALDHPWIDEHPDYFVGGTEADLAGAPANYVRLATTAGERIFAYGRDPFFAGWPDTLQIDYANPAAREAMLSTLVSIAGRADGVRCDMAMLVLPDVFERTWGRRPEPFWPEAIAAVKADAPGFCFMAEVYWDLEWTLQQQGFDYAYDKRLYDRLREGHARPVREHFYAGLDYQDRLARFLENHDEPRAAATFPAGQHEAAAAITFLSPGLRFFHQGQLEGWQTRISPHLVRAPLEPANPTLRAFYDRLLAALRRPSLGGGQWQLLPCHPAWDGNWTSDAFLAFLWTLDVHDRVLVTVNYSDHQSQCRVPLPLPDLAGHRVRLDDLLSPAAYDRAGGELISPGLYLDVPAWGCHAFSVNGMHAI